MHAGATSAESNAIDPDRTLDVQCNQLPGCRMASVPAGRSGTLPRDSYSSGIG